MPDITMCMNTSCELRKSCYRYRANPSKYRQSYSLLVPEDGICEHFWNTSHRSIGEFRSTYEADRNNREDFPEIKAKYSSCSCGDSSQCSNTKNCLLYPKIKA